MKIKLDENLGARGAEILARAGHDVMTVAQQGMSGANDPALITVCAQEKRCLVTLDMDFANPLMFTPSEYAGIAVLRLPARATPADLLFRVRTLANHLSRSSIRGKLWIVDAGRVREYQEEFE
jgi:predicted nuclease of predicted toxin-antitoxin system